VLFFIFHLQNSVRPVAHIHWFRVFILQLSVSAAIFNSGSTVVSVILILNVQTGCVCGCNFSLYFVYGAL
jgi:hypothetical protein